MIRGTRTTVRVWRNPAFCRGVRLWFVQYDPTNPNPNGSILVPEKLVFQEIKPGEPIPESCQLSLYDEDAQILMDELWDCRIRSTRAAGSVGQLEAVQKHLQDMRTIAFNKLKVERP